MRPRESWPYNRWHEDREMDDAVEEWWWYYKCWVRMWLSWAALWGNWAKVGEHVKELADPRSINYVPDGLRERFTRDFKYQWRQGGRGASRFIDEWYEEPGEPDELPMPLPYDAGFEEYKPTPAPLMRPPRR